MVELSVRLSLAVFTYLHCVWTAVNTTRSELLVGYVLCTATDTLISYGTYCVLVLHLWEPDNEVKTALVTKDNN